MKLTVKYYKELVPNDEFYKTFEAETSDDCKGLQYDFERQFSNIGNYKSEIVELVEN